MPHNFIGIALLRADHDSLPLISNVIYSAICNRFGIDAAPCSFPGHVHSVVSPSPDSDLDGKSPGDREPMYMDPFRSPEEVPVSALLAQLSHYPGLHDSPEQRDAFLAPATPIELTLRCGRNISNSASQVNAHPLNITTTIPPAPRIDDLSARYAACWATLMLTVPSTTTPFSTFQAQQIFPMIARVRSDLQLILTLIINHFSYDACLVNKYLLSNPNDQPILMMNVGQNLNLHSALRELRERDSQPKPPKRRSEYPPNHVKYRIGQVFIHKRYRYRAVITGWDAKCDQSLEWIGSMGVDNLSGGREQSFYSAM